MLLDDEGRNVSVLVEWANLVPFVENLWRLWYGEEMTSGVIRPGWPRAFLEEKALLLAIMKMIRMSGEKLRTSHRDQKALNYLS